MTFMHTKFLQVRYPIAPFFVVLGAALVLSANAADAQNPAPSEFAWRATLTLPAGAGVGRVALPPEAMLHMQSSDARDMRVFNAQGDAVPFAVSAPALTTAAPAQTRAYAAHPMFVAGQGKRPVKGWVRVRVGQNNGSDSVWVDFANKDRDPALIPMQSALFDTRAEKQTIDALDLQGVLPANTLVHFTVESSADLARWEPVEVRGPVFRFEGADAPSSHTLELAQSVRLTQRYLRLSWEGQAGVQVNGLKGNVAQAWARLPHLRAALPPGAADGNTAMQWTLNFATPMAALHLGTTRDNTLVPVRVLGRNDTAQPWRVLARSVMYRMANAGQNLVNAPVNLGGASVRFLRVESANGLPLPVSELQATVEFEPMQMAFLGSGAGPFEWAVGRARTNAAAVEASLLTSIINGKLDDLPRAQISNVRVSADAGSGAPLLGLLPAGTEPRNALLWLVLVGGVLLLAGAAYALLRQLSAKPKTN